MGELTDLEITKACARAIGMAEIYCSAPNPASQSEPIYWPLTNDKQAMTLAKRFRLSMIPDPVPASDPLSWWFVSSPELKYQPVQALSLNHAICMAVARMKGATEKGVEEGK